jgi:hypothetical protein
MKVEIKKNTEAIRIHLERCPEVCETIQKLYNKLNSNGLVTSFKVVMEVTTKYLFASKQTNSQNQSVFDGQKEISDLLKNLTIDSSPENVKVMGFKMNREKLFDLIAIELEDIQEVLTLIDSISIEDHCLFKHLDFDSEIVKVKLVSGYAAQIVASHTVFADNEKQIKVTEVLLKLAASLNDYRTVCANFDDPDNIDGLILTKTGYSLDVARIKKI